MVVWWLGILACTQPNPSPSGVEGSDGTTTITTPPATTDTTPTTTTTPSGTPSTPTTGTTGTTPAPPPTHLELLPCARGEECAPDGPFVDGTCCALGDPLTHDTFVHTSEILDIETDGEILVHCTAFGVGAGPLDPDTMDHIMPGGFDRCGAAQLGPRTPTGLPIAWPTFYGDPAGIPALRTYHVVDDRPPVRIDEQVIEGQTLGGLGWDGERLWVTAFADGVHRYTVDDQGTPTHLDALGGFDNAVDVVVGPAHAYVADGTTLRVFAPLEAPEEVGRVEIARVALDLELVDDTVFVAVGSQGVHAIDVSDPSAPVERGHLPSDGSAVRLDAHGGRLAVAHWSHAAVYDAETLALLGSETVNEGFEQDYAIAIWGDQVFVGEWLAVHALRIQPGRIGPDLWVPGSTVIVGEDRPVQLPVTNRGPVDLTLAPVVLQADSVSVDPPSAVVAPGATQWLDVTWDGGTLPEHAELSLASDDPDPPRRLPIRQSDGDGLGEGDPITADFGFLDPTGAGDIENLRGQVTFVAYFALY